jgi:ribonuclease BN (tRNA processing enzyme)
VYHSVSRIYLLIFCALLIPTRAAVAECVTEQGISLQVLGSGGPEMDDRRASSGYLVWQGDRAIILVDAGSGTALNFEKSGADLTHLKAVLFTHFHVDHSVDFPSLVKASYFTEREVDLPVYGPAGNEFMPPASEFVANLLGEGGAYPYLKGYLNDDSDEDYKITVTDVPLSPRKIQRYQLGHHISLSAVPVHHGPLPAIAWRVDMGGCSLSFGGDLSNRYDTLTGLAKGSDLLVANNAIPEGATGAARSLHMPPSEIGRVASTAAVGQLILSHRMQRTLGREQQTVTEIRKYFSGPVLFANDLDRFGISHPKLGSE